jgi:flagellin
MRAQIRGIEMASKNSEDAISLVQTAEGALTETHSILQRMNELAVQSASDTNETIDRGALQAEFTQLTAEINDIASQTKFNNKYLLNGSFSGISLAEGSTYTATDVAITGSPAVGTFSNFSYAAATDAGDAKSVTNGGSVTISDYTAADTYTITEDTGTFTVTNGAGDTITSNYDGVSKNLTFAGITVNTGTAATSDYNNTTVVVTAATISADFTADGTTTSSSVSGTFNANGSITFGTTTDNVTLSGDAVTTVEGGSAEDLTIDSSAMIIQTGANTAETLSISIGNMAASAIGVIGISVDTQENAESAIDAVTSAINTVSTQRANLGAYQNRLEHKINNLDTSSENLQAAESRIRDVDMASEMVEFTKNNILLQAAQSMLAQANAQPQGVLQLLQ